MLGALLALAMTGCGRSWVYTYVEAENIAKPAEEPILVFYRDHLDVKSSQLQETLEQGRFDPLLDKFVLCSLVSAYGPNRRYMAQYGVTSPPALVIIHPDGTYHALTEFSGAERIEQFIINSQPPGQRPQVDYTVARPTDYLIRAEGIYEKALEKSRRQNRALMIVYKWWLDAESNELLTRMARPEVASRCAETVNCVLDWDYVPNRGHVAQYGVTDYPAIIVVHQDGSHQVLRGLSTVDEIVRFLAGALSRDRRARP